MHSSVGLSQNARTQVRMMRARASTLRDAAAASDNSQNDALLETCEELNVSLEELQAVQEELEAQNRHLLAARSDLEAERERYRRLFEDAPVAYIVTNTEGTIKQANREAGALLGVRPQYLVGKPLTIFVDNVHRPSVVALLRKKARVPQEENVRLRPRKGEAVDAIVTVTSGADPAHSAPEFRWAIRNVTEQKRAEERLRTLHAELEERVAERTAQLAESRRHLDELLRREQRARADAEAASSAKDRLLAQVSHELRTPLSAVLTSIALLDALPQVTDDMRFSLDLMRRNTELVARLLDDLLDASSIIHGKLRLSLHAMDLHGLLTSVQQICTPHVERKQLRFRLNLAASRSFVHADPDRLHQVFWNLIMNAIKFTHAHGSVAVSTSNPIPGIIRVTVVDTGRGIQPEILPHIFTAFEQGPVEQPRSGLGLGLAITRGLVEAHGGTIIAASEGEGKGATFLVELPLMDSVAPPQRSHER
jgi:PAS domain S-box-containing protein